MSLYPLAALSIWLTDSANFGGSRMITSNCLFVSRNFLKYLNTSSCMFSYFDESIPLREKFFSASVNDSAEESTLITLLAPALTA